jgi:hypothetical protein
MKSLLEYLIAIPCYRGYQKSQNPAIKPMICQFHHVDIFKAYFCIMYLSMILSFTAGSHEMSYHLVSLVHAADTVNPILLNSVTLTIQGDGGTL